MNTKLFFLSCPQVFTEGHFCSSPHKQTCAHARLAGCSQPHLF